MSSDPLRTEAAANLQRHLAENAYPGRGLILGRSTSGAWTIVYWLMGRSNNSRNRRHWQLGPRAKTVPPGWRTSFGSFGSPAGTLRRTWLARYSSSGS